MAESFLDSLFSLKDKVVVITGGGGCLAGAMARGVARCGARVAVLDIDQDKALKTASSILKEDGCALALKVDVRDKSSLQNACDVIVNSFGKIDCLINGAGGSKFDAVTSETVSFFDLSMEAIQSVFDLNLMGTILASQVFGREIVKQNTGSIINVASIAGLKPLTRVIAYSAAKSAVVNFTAWLAVHMCHHYSKSIRVNSISPGFCLAEQNRSLLLDDKNEKTERAKKILTSVPQNRFGQPEEFISAAIWLLSDSSSFTTGTVISIDGGFDAYSGV
jgi:NAD(P)-dependent dehydrogenase (short-subunit alcohol dehydrogenase family)